MALLLNDHKFGRNREIANGVQEDITDFGNVTPPTVAEEIFMAGESALEDVPIMWHGLDENWVYKEAEFTVNGQTPTSIGNWTRIWRGFNNTTTGDDMLDHVWLGIDDTDFVGGIPQTQSEIRGKIHSDAQQTQMAFYTVPAGYTMTISMIWVSVEASNIVNITGVDLDLFVRNFGNVWRSKLPFGVGSLKAGAPGTLPPIVFDPLMFADSPLQEKTDIKVVATPTGAAADVSATFAYHLQPS